MKINLKGKGLIKKIALALAGVAAITALGFGVKAIVDYTKNDLKTITPSFEVGNLGADGKYVDDEGTLYTKEAFGCYGLQVKPDFDSTVNYQIFYYDILDNYISSTEVLSDGYSKEAPINGAYARIVIEPKDDEDGKISLTERVKYPMQLTVKVKKNQDINNRFCVFKGRTMQVVNDTADLLFENNIDLDTATLEWRKANGNCVTSSTVLSVVGSSTVVFDFSRLNKSSGTTSFKVFEFKGLPSTENFISYTGNEPTIMLNYGEKLDIYSLDEPNRAGYIFAGWYFDSYYTLPLTNDFNIYANLSLHAKWIPKVNHSANRINKDGILDEITTTNTQKVETSFYIPIYFSGVLRLNWHCFFKSQNKEGNTYFTGLIKNCNIECTIFDVTSQLIVYYRCWDHGYRANELYKGETTLNLIPGHEYKAYCSDRSAPASIDNGHLGIFPQGTFQIYNVGTKKNLNINVPIYSIKQVYDEKTVYPDVNYRGYDFIGWYDENNDLITDVWNYTADKSFHAGWRLHNYSIKYNLNNGINHSSNPANYNLESEEIILQTPVKTGYTFEGWYTDSNFTQQITALYGADCCDYNLYAKWSANTYTATLDYDGGQNCPIVNFYSKDELIKSQALYKNSTMSYYIPDNSDKNVVFGGWFTDLELTNEFNFSGTVNTDLNLYAKWVDISKVNYCNVGSDIAVTINGNANQYLAIVLPTSQTLTITSSSGLDLYGEIYDLNWNLLALSDDISDTNLDFSVTLIMQQGQIYYIGYKANQAAIQGDAIISISGTDESLSFITGDYTEVVETIDVTYDSPVSLPNPQKEGYVFAGWYDELGNVVDISYWKYARNINLFAHWTAKS